MCSVAVCLAAGTDPGRADLFSLSAFSRRNRELEATLKLTRLVQNETKERKEEEENGKRNARGGLTALDFRLRREERRRKLLRTSSLRSTKPNDESEENTVPEKEVETKNPTVVLDVFGNEVYVRGETATDILSRELDQWIKKMKCNGSNASLAQFRDIKVGVYGSSVVYGSPSYEPYPSLEKEKFTFSGGKDNQKRFHGKGTIEFEDGSFMMGYWVHGVRQGIFKVETNRNNVCFLDGEYSDNKLNGKGSIHFNDMTWLEGYFKDGVLHGFCRYFDSKNRLTFLGMHRNGLPFGTCWKIIRGGGCVVGCVDEMGKLSGVNIAYIYPDFQTGLVGNFKDGELEFGQVAQVKKVVTDNFGIKLPQFTEPEGRLYRKELSTYTFVTSNPTLPDPYETTMVEVKLSRVPGAHDGLFSRKSIKPNTVLAFYNGVKVDPLASEGETWDNNAYKIFDPAVKNGTVDIPEEFRDITNYSASLAHKTNHSFVPNSEFMVFNHPRFGKIPCIASIHQIAKGEEIFVRYGYELNYCPDWYLEAWEKGNYPVPDSMKAEYSSSSSSAASSTAPTTGATTAPAWAEATNDDKANQLPDPLL